MTFRTLSRRIAFCFQVGADWRTSLRLLRWTVALKLFRRFAPSRVLSANQVLDFRVNTRRGPLVLRMRLMDLPIFYEVFYSHAYRVPAPEGSAPATLIDLGAHIGLVTVYLWSNCYQNGEFFCVEPSAANLPLLEFNTQGLPVTIIRKAVDGEAGRAFLDEEAIAYNHRLSQDPSGRPVEVITVSQILSVHDIQEVALLKMDIEGSEKEVMKKAGNWLDRVQMLIVELHTGYAEADLMEDISEFGFTLTRRKTTTLFLNRDS